MRIPSVYSTTDIVTRCVQKAFQSRTVIISDFHHSVTFSLESSINNTKEKKTQLSTTDKTQCRLHKHPTELNQHRVGKKPKGQVGKTKQLKTKCCLFHSRFQPASAFLLSVNISQHYSFQIQHRTKARLRPARIPHAVCRIICAYSWVRSSRLTVSDLMSFFYCCFLFVRLSSPKTRS